MYSFEIELLFDYQDGGRPKTVIRKLKALGCGPTGAMIDVLKKFEDRTSLPGMACAVDCNDTVHIETTPEVTARRLLAAFKKPNHCTPCSQP